MKKIIKDFAESLGIKYKASKDNWISFNGVNGGVTIIDFDDKDWRLVLANHLKQMGRDSLKIDLERLLDIAKHN